MIGFEQIELAWIVAFQSLGNWLVVPMKFFSFLGVEEFYLIALPFLYWCVDAGLGLRVGVMMLFSSGLNTILKIPFHGPRPYWVSTAVKPLWAETSFGIPSGHAQQAVAVWGFTAGSIKRTWAWLIAIALMFMIGLSRVYLGAHFFLDILAGWLIGGVLLWLFLRFWEPVSSWVRPQSTGVKILFAFLVSIIMVMLAGVVVFQSTDYQLPSEWLSNALRAGEETPEPVALSGVLTSAGTLFGMLAGVAGLDAQGGWKVSGPWPQRVARYLLGVIGVLLLWFGLGAIFPRGESFIPYVLRFIRYALIGAWVSAGAPLLFGRVRLS
jgi:membrane-associated phospholipid phosphatase